jgi:hypothetical protein
MKIKTEITQYGFTFGPATIERCCSDDKRGMVVLLLKTPKRKNQCIQIYVTKTGKVRIYNEDGKEWKNQ